MHIYEACFHGCEHPVCEQRTRGRQEVDERKGEGARGSHRAIAPFICFTLGGWMELVCDVWSYSLARSLARWYIFNGGAENVRCGKREYTGIMNDVRHKQDI